MPAYGQGNAGQDRGAQEPQVAVTDYETVDIAVQDADLAQVLQMLSLQARKNIISSRNVSATVTANLYDVTFYEALDAILTVNGYTYVEEGNFIYVYTMEEYRQIREAQRARVQQIFDLDHLSAQDAMSFITPLLSEAGRASARGEVSPGMVPTVGNAGADDYPYNVKIVVFDYPENLQMIADLISELDTAPQQVLVEATILQTTVDEANAFGIDFSVIGNMNFTDIMSPLGPVTALLNGSDPQSGFQPGDNKAIAGQSTVGDTRGPGGMKIGIVSNDISVFLRVLDQVTDTTVLARPKVMALNRQRAEVLVGARVGYLSTTATETTTTQTVQFLDTGVQLVFRPFISKDGTIRMELKPSVSEASLRTVTDSLGSQVTIPDELTNEVTTNVRIRDGQTLVLGGLFRESSNITRRQVPLLGDIPILGAAFRGQDDRIERQEIIFLITPTITKDELLWQQGSDALVFADLVRVGAREGLLPFSREKMTSAHNQHAVAAEREGDTELALYHIRNSLRLNPNQPTLVAMRQRLSGEVEQHYERSMLEYIMNQRMKSQQRSGEPAGASSSKHTPDSPINPLVELHQISDPEAGDDEGEAENLEAADAEATSDFEGAEHLESADDVEFGLDNETNETNEADSENNSDSEQFSDDVEFGLDSETNQTAPENNADSEQFSDDVEFGLEFDADEPAEGEMQQFWFDFDEDQAALPASFWTLARSSADWWVLSAAWFKSDEHFADEMTVHGSLRTRSE